MGYTQHSWDIVNYAIDNFKPKSMVDLGSQNNYAQPNLPAPFVRATIEPMGIEYTSIDLSGEDGCLVLDLTKPIKIGQFPLVCDMGTSEHLGKGGKYDVEAFYNGWLNKHNLCEIGGIIISENPKSESWPSHGFQYMTNGFYEGLEKVSDYEILDLHSWPACGNEKDGWNIVCVMKKNGDKFPDLETFSKLDFRTS